MEMEESMVERVENNSQRGYSYQENIKRYGKAMKEGFYFEALLIDYALIEDRLRSYLYYIGAFDRRDDKRVCRKTRKPLADMKTGYLKGGKPEFRMYMITEKMDVVRATLLWFKGQEESPADDRYRAALWKQYSERIDADEFLELLGAINTWKDKRNEIVHGLLGKDVNALMATVEPLCEEGFDLFRRLDGEVKNVKFGNSIRRAMRMRSEK